MYPFTYPIGALTTEQALACQFRGILPRCCARAVASVQCQGNTASADTCSPNAQRAAVLTYAARQSAQRRSRRSLGFAPLIAVAIAASVSGSSADAPTTWRAWRYLQSWRGSSPGTWWARLATKPSSPQSTRKTWLTRSSVRSAMMRSRNTSSPACTLVAMVSRATRRRRGRCLSAQPSTAISTRNTSSATHCVRALAWSRITRVRRSGCSSRR